ncbi:MAG: hypothetical protein R3284_08795 [Rubricoccaceae bacterium]|nr:hypothetical protein [Rubricoccaceae bacterium]
MIWVTLILSMIAGYLVFWSGVVSLIGFAGWRQIAEYYPADAWPEEEGIALSWQSGGIWASNYNGVLKTVVTDSGLYLRPVRMFAFNHPPIFIPWDAVVSTKKAFWGGLRLDLEGGRAITLRGKVVRHVQGALDVFESDVRYGTEAALLDELQAMTGESQHRPAERKRTRT